ncbi:MAG: hypothetical protein ACRC8S_00155 [Fimbriiglobus sp.]
MVVVFFGESTDLPSLAGHEVRKFPLAARESFGTEVDLLIVNVSQERLTEACHSTRYLRADMGDRLIPILWLAESEFTEAGYEAGADAILPVLDSATLGVWCRQRQAIRKLGHKADEVRAVNEQLQATYATEAQYLELIRRIRAQTPAEFPTLPGWRFETRTQERGSIAVLTTEDQLHFRLLDAPAPGIISELVRLAVDAPLSHLSCCEPSEMLVKMNTSLLNLHLDPPVMVGALVGRLNLTTRKLHFARAGYPTPLETPGNYLGLFPETYTNHETTIDSEWESFGLKITAIPGVEDECGAAAPHQEH